jgi:MoaA/NifB/PqqE/SkfB family radical SAM enzyme
MMDFEDLLRDINKLNKENKLQFDCAKYYEGSLVIKNIAEDPHHIKFLLKEEFTKHDDILSNVTFDNFSPSEFEGTKFIIIHKDITKTGEYYKFLKKFENEFTEENLINAKKWLEQFPFFKWKLCALNLLSEIIYLDEKKIEDKLRQLTKYMGDGDFVISEIEGIAKSSAHLFYPLNKITTMSSKNFIPSKSLNPSDKRDIVFIDDMIGTGNQAIKYIDILKSNGNIIDQKLNYFAIVGLHDGIEKLKEAKTNGIPLFKKVEVVDEIENKAFDTGYIFTTNSGDAKDIVSKIGEQLSENMPLGYEDSQALVFFRHNTPNNSLPIFWASGECKLFEYFDVDVSVKWNPLFPRKEKPPIQIDDDDPDFRKTLLENLKKIIGYLFSIDTILEENLNNGNVSKEMRKIFKTKGFSLSKKSTISKKSSKWVIKDNKIVYILAKEGGKLNVYKNIDEKKDIAITTAQILLKIIENGNVSSLFTEKEYSKTITKTILKDDSGIRTDCLEAAISMLLSEGEKYFGVISNEVILRLNEFQQKIKEYIFNTSAESRDFTYILKIIDCDKKAVSYISDSFNFLEEKQDYEPYTLADEVQANDTIRIMSYHYRYALIKNKIMHVFQDKIKDKVKIKILLMHPYSDQIRLPQTRSEILEATCNLLDIAINKASKYLEVRYYGKNLNSGDASSSDSKEFLFRGHIYGDRAVAFIPFPSRRFNGEILGDPYYLTWDSQRVHVFKTVDNNFSLSVIELYQNYFDDIWYKSSTTLSEFLNEKRMNEIENNLYEKFERQYESYKINKNISNWYESKKDIESKILNKKLVQVQIHPTDDCNLKCSFCFYKDVNSKTEMKHKILEKIIDGIKQYKDVRIIFSGGGEPTKYEELPKIIKLCKVEGLAIGLITNGTFEDDISNCINISNFAKIKGYGSKDFYNKIVKNIKNISEQNNRSFEVSIGYAVGNKNGNLSDVYSFLDFLRDKFQSEIKVMFRPIIDIRNEHLSKNEVLTSKQIIILLENIFEIEKRMPMNAKHNLDDFKKRLEILRNTQGNPIGSCQCYVAHSGPIIEPDGHVYSCHIRSKLSRMSEGNNLSIGKISEENDFSIILEKFNDECNGKDGIFHCDTPQFCNPRDIAFNVKVKNDDNEEIVGKVTESA